MSKKIRLDVLLVEKGYLESRQKAQTTIMSGLVYVNNQKVDKPGTAVAEDAVIEVRGNALKYVSRGGLKLEKAMQTWPIDLTDTICMDVGASTGGFTQCALEKGASQVFAVDVGSGQLAPQLVADSRVCNLEKTDIRLLRAEQLAAIPDFAACDVSFISLRLVLPAIAALLSQTGEAVVLIKPQFEAGRSSVGRGGIVKDAKVHLRVLQEMVDTFHANGFLIGGMTVSPITGGDGNVEFLAWLRRAGEEAVPNLEDLVKKAHLLK